MKELFEKMIERLKEVSWWTEPTFDEEGYHNDDSEEVVYLDKAIKIVNELAEEHQPNQAHQFAILHADILARLGVDISSKWEDAKQQAEALEQAYLRGRQDEKETVNGPITNAERIRAMDDTELAEFLKNTVWQNGANLFDCKEYLQECCVGHCEQCNAYLKWLQKHTETHECD